MIRATFFKYLWLLELILGGKREEVRNELNRLLFTGGDGNTE